MSAYSIANELAINNHAELYRQVTGQDAVPLLYNILSDERVAYKFTRLHDHHALTAHHSLRVSVLAMGAGIKLNMPEDDVRLLGYAGLLHDFGKIGIPREVLDKPAKLDFAERKLIEQHPLLGYEPLRIIFPDMLAISTVSKDHHNFQSNPYPEAHILNTADQYTQIIAVADMFDALRHKRPYQMHETLDDRQAIDIVKTQYTGDAKHLRTIEDVLGI